MEKDDETNSDSAPKKSARQLDFSQQMPQPQPQLQMRSQSLSLVHFTPSLSFLFLETEGNFPGLMPMPILKVPAFVVCVCVCVIMLCDWLLSLDFAWVIIGSQDLEANHAVRQHVDIVSENQKYNK